MEITEDVPKYAAEQGSAEEEALKWEWRKSPASSPGKASFTRRRERNAGLSRPLR